MNFRVTIVYFILLYARLDHGNFFTRLAENRLLVEIVPRRKLPVAFLSYSPFVGRKR